MTRASTRRTGPAGRTARAGRAVGWAAGVAVLAGMGLALPEYWVYLGAAVAIGALVARGAGLATRRAGLLVLSQLSFAAIGGWIAAALALAWPALPHPLVVLAGGLAAAPVGLLLGFATLRIRGIEFAVVTLGFAAALDLVLRQGSFPGVGTGTPVIPSAPFAEPRVFFALAWAVLLLTHLGVAALGRTRFGLAWPAVAASERAAVALGLRVGVAKAGALAVSAALAGLAGGLMAGQYGLLSTQMFSPLASLVVVATAVLTGASLLSGAVLAGLLSVFVPELLRRVGLPLDLGNALLAFGAFDVLRRGGGGIADQVRRRIEDRRFRDIRVTCDLTPGARPPAEPTPGAPTGGGPAGGGSAGPADPVGPADPALRVRRLSVRLGGQAVLTAVDLELDAGEVHALVGANGAGKSTLIDALCGFLPEASGEVLLGPERIDGASATHRARAGLRRTFQHVRSFEALTVGEVLRLTAGRAPAERLRLARREFGLPEDGVPIRLLDLGSRRVLELAAAAAAGPRVLLLDEPAAGLGETERLALAERVRRLPEVFGCAVLLVEHDMGVVRAAATRTTVLDGGRVLTHGRTGEVLADPRVTAVYFGSAVNA